MKNVVIGLVILLCGSMAAASDWSAWSLGSDQGAAARMEYKASTRMSLFVEGNWYKSLPGNESGLVGGAIGALWFVNPDANVPISGWVDFLPKYIVGWLPDSIPVAFYVGADGGFQENSQFSSKLLGGFLVNPKDKVNLGFEMSYDFTQDSWRNGISMPKNDKLAGMISLRYNF